MRNPADSRAFRRLAATAMAADYMSSTISAIRRDAESVATASEAIEGGFANGDGSTRFRPARRVLTGFAA